MRIAVLCMGLVLAGCATESSMVMVSRSDRQMAMGTVDWFAQHASVTLHGRNYQGDYILMPAPQAMVIINNNQEDRKGEQHSSTSMPRSQNGTGKMLLLSNDGDTLRCEFSYEESLGMKAIGACTDAQQKEYDLQIRTAF